jgi:hypothetical protein
MAQSSTTAGRELVDALDCAARRGVLGVASAGNQTMSASTTITRHPSIVPVMGYGLDGRPTVQSNLGCSMGKRGLGHQEKT